MVDSFDRGEYLKQQFNQYWSSILNNNQDYFSQMTDESFDLLKSTLININNIITYNTTLKFVEKVCSILNVDKDEKKLIIDRVKSAKPSDNGYDIEYNGSISFICEVKCNRPINGGNRFGSAQKTGIEKDLYSLIKGKTKSSIKSNKIDEYYKFMVIYNFGENTVQAVQHYISHLTKELKYKVKLYNESDILNKDIIYVVLFK